MLADHCLSFYFAKLSNDDDFSENKQLARKSFWWSFHWYYKLSPMYTDYVAIKRLVKSDPLLVNYMFYIVVASDVIDYISL